jgi:TRAP-type C4-dicarboxylate transport system permease small subunit
MLSALGRLHDRVTAAGFAGGAACVGVIAVSFWYEVAARYFFSSPTDWAYAVASYALSPMIFLSMPAMTRRGAHIAIGYLVDNLPAPRGRALRNAVLLIAAVVCLAAAWLGAGESLRQYIREEETISALPVPKWWITIFIPYGMASSALYFVRQLMGDGPLAEEGAAP